MELVDSLTRLIGDLGFPIMITLALFHQNSKNNEVLKEMNVNIATLSIIIEELRKER